jgi:hypothetical protein
MSNDKTINQLTQWAFSVLNAKEATFKSSVVVQTPWSIVIKIQNGKDCYYLKQTPPDLYIETEIIAAIVKNNPDSPMPNTLFKNDELNCFLMNSCGDYSLRAKFNGVIDDRLLIQGLNSYIKTLRSFEHNFDGLLGVDVPDWRVKRFPELYISLLENKDKLLGEGLTLDEIEQLIKLTPTIKLICDSLSDKKIKETLVNCDFNENNLIINENTQQISIIDWGESVIAHPFFSIASHLKSTARRYKLDLNGPRLESIKQQCLSCWSDMANRNELNEIYQNILSVHPVFSALGLHRLQMATNNTSREMQRWFIAGELQTFLKNERKR